MDEGTEHPQRLGPQTKNSIVIRKSMASIMIGNIDFFGLVADTFDSDAGGCGGNCRKRCSVTRLRLCDKRLFAGALRMSGRRSLDFGLWLVKGFAVAFGGSDDFGAGGLLGIVRFYVMTLHSTPIRSGS